MEAATAIQLRRAPSVYDTASLGQAADSSQTLAVSATYLLSEQGRKASLLAGGDGRAIQELTIQVPASRLHLVSVDANGVARLKLRPRFQLDGEHGVIRIDTLPTYDAPPALDDLFQEAARNHQLEEAFDVARRTARTKRQDVDRERHARIAQAFLADRDQRALVHPAPTEKRCYLSTEHGRLLFDAQSHEELARQVTVEAHRRFRADLRERKERNLQARAAQLAVHDEKKNYIAEWIAAHGTPEQRARHAARMLPIDEAIEAIADAAFAALKDKPRYSRDGLARLHSHLAQFAQCDAAVLTTSNLTVTSSNARQATSTQWAFVQEIQRALPEATVVLREHRLAWKQNASAPALTVFSLLVTARLGPFLLRREYDPEAP
jgi:hypothetical protein